MNFSAIWAIVLRQLYLMRSNYSRVLSVFVWILVDILLWGFITRYLKEIAPQVSLVTLFLGMVLMWDFFGRVMHGITITFFEDMWARNFVNLFSAPISLPEYLLGLVASSVLTSLLGLAAMLLLAISLFGLSYAAYGLYVVIFFVLLFLFGIALGITAVSLVLRLGPSAEWIVWPLPMVISPFVGVFYPIGVLPKWMQAAAMLLPPSYVFESARAIMSNGTSLDNSGLVAAFLLDVVYIVGAGLLFVRTYRRCVKSGLLARYTSENIT